VLDAASATADSRGLQQQAATAPPQAILVGRGNREPWTRALLVDRGQGSTANFLRRGAEVCRRLGVDVVVLAVDRSDRLAQSHQDQVRSALIAQGLEASFDSVCGVELGMAIACVARLRQCQLVVVESEKQRWRLWGRRREIDWVLDMADTTSVLFLPAAPAEVPAGSEPSTR
jgi:K+-sensing histidine kinase KdpD